ncbi:UNVERIFIED_CONTAM: hypothetical protein K2H54_033241 [Gekko kuhli]
MGLSGWSEEESSQGGGGWVTQIQRGISAAERNEYTREVVGGGKIHINWCLATKDRPTGGFACMSKNKHTSKLRWQRLQLGNLRLCYSQTDCIPIMERSILKLVGVY